MTSSVEVSAPVAAAVEGARPLVALETSVLAQGLPAPRNDEAAGSMERAIRERGAEPAWTWVGNGAVRVGATEAELAELMSSDAATKVARRDLPFAVASGSLGATTVSAMVWAAHRAGIDVAATGGIGGVHHGEDDVSADLRELATTPITLVSSGPKSILDPVRTAARLEELGVALVGYRCERLPYFVVREAPVALEHRAESPGEVAAIVRARSVLDMDAALLVCNPIPERHALPADEIADAVARCRAQAEAAGISGKAVTPYLLRCLAERTDGATLEANLALLEANAALAADIAVAVASE